MTTQHQERDENRKNEAAMSKAIIIAGGTDGIGRAVADILLERGDRVTILGTSHGKGRTFVEQGAETPGKARFIHADLSTIAGNRAAIETIREAHDAIDALILCARFVRSKRHVTADGLEDNFALNYLSRYLFSYGLETELASAPNAVVVNISGPGGELSLIRWDDLQLERGYDGVAAMFQAGKLNDLLGVAFAGRPNPEKPRYVLFHPDSTATSFAGELDAEMRAHVEALKRSAKPASAAAVPIIRLIDQPPDESLSAFILEREIDVKAASFDPGAARRLDQLTKQIIS